MDAQLRKASPVIVVGMHRSGTRLIVEVLERLGVFMGADRQADAESVTFMAINEGLLHQCGAFWSEPMSAHFALAQPDFAERLAESAEHALISQLSSYGGTSGWPRGNAEQIPVFGWKDPRNTFTLPVWTRVFPNARVLHIVRHGVDVAQSLARRHARALLSATGERAPSALTVIRDHALGVLSSRRGWTLDEAFTMWEQYVEKARLESADLGPRALEIRFEDLLTRPERVVPAISRFCGVPNVELSDQPELIDPSRAFAFRADPDLAGFSEAVGDRLGRYGYEP
jgi:hypothetical protein